MTHVHLSAQAVCELSQCDCEYALVETPRGWEMRWLRPSARALQLLVARGELDWPNYSRPVARRQ